MEEKKVLLSVNDLEVNFTVKGSTLNIIRKCSFDLHEDEVLAIVGESGSGKSVLTKAVVGMLDNNGCISGGTVFYDGKKLSDYSTDEQWMTIRGKEIAMVMQDPMTALDPLMTVGRQIEEAITLHQGLGKKEAKAEAIRMLERVGITDCERRYSQYPHELSGGQKQRVVIAIACSCRPKILICDEPTTALDVTVQNQILDLLKELRDELDMSVIIITHDLGVVADIADTVAVMYAGEFVEIGKANEIFYDAWHPYTWALLAAIPQLGKKGEALPTIDGTPPNRFSEIKGDAFAPRNKMALAIDFIENPPWFDLTPTHRAKTWYLDPRCKGIERPEHVTHFHERLVSVYGEHPNSALAAE